MRCGASGSVLVPSKGKIVGVVYPEGVDPTNPTGGTSVVALKCPRCSYREVWRETREGWLATHPVPEAFSEHERKS